jgi:hypothetical protein
MVSMTAYAKPQPVAAATAEVAHLFFVDTGPAISCSLKLKHAFRLHSSETDEPTGSIIFGLECI